MKYQHIESVPEKMTAVAFREFGEPEVLRPELFPTPEPGEGEVLVRVRAVSIGRLLDLAARAGTHPWATFKFPHILGAEHAGEIAAVGEGVLEWVPGDRVAVYPGIVPPDDPDTLAGHLERSPQMQVLGTHLPGAYAEYTVVPARNLLPVPKGMTSAEAATALGAGAVAMNQFMNAGGIGPDSRVIVQGATSALGSTTALLAKHLGAQVVVTTRDAGKAATLRGLGFEHVLNALDDDFADKARAAFGGRGATVIIDNLGSPEVWDHGFDALDIGGAIVSSGSFLGRTVPLKLGLLYSRNQRIIGVRTGNLQSVEALWAEVQRGFRSVIDREFPLAEAAAAHHYLQSGGNVGRVLLIP